MEEEPSGTGMGFGSVVLRKPTPSRPQPSMQQQASRASMDSLSMVSSFGDNDSERSFTNLLVGVISSPTSDDGRDEGSSPAGPRGGSFAERLAARGAANKDMEMGGNGAGYWGLNFNHQPKVLPPSRISMPQTSYQLTIPPGLSPSQLLESPVFLTNVQQAEPSPTTGTFPMPPYGCREVSNEKVNDPGFVFKPFPKPVSRNPLSPLAGMVQQPFSQSHLSSQPQVQQGGQSGVGAVMSSATSLGGQIQGVNTNTAALVAVPLSMPPLPNSMQQSEPLQTRSPEQEQQASVAPPFAERPSEDGYNWRKYGQKQVKGSEYPRSYYKCTQANCPMKKKVERSHDGQVTEIVYKGDHNHPKPQPTRRMAVAAPNLITDICSGDGDGKEFGGFHTGNGREGGYYGGKHERGGPDDRNRNFGLSLGPNGTADPSTPSTSEDGSKSITEDGDDDEPDSKRRRKEKNSMKELPPAPRTIREPRVVVQTTSDVDILDDGYRWRKYGQKVVKGNPNPRSYYKCTHVGCPVRKHVERASNDPKAVITTYEGKHNHDVPVARNSSHDTSGLGGSMSAPSQSGAGPVPAAPSDPQQDRYGRSSVFGRLLDNPTQKGGDPELGMGVGVGPVGQASWGIDGNSNSLSGTGDVPDTSISMNNSSLLGRSMDPYSGVSGMQDAGLRPKQERGDSHSHSDGLQPNVYHSQRLVMGP